MANPRISELAPNRLPPFLILRLAVSDLLHERLLTFCLVAAIGAIAAPLLVLWGLRVGLVENLRHDLVEDPVFRSISPKSTEDYDERFFSTLRARDDVAFLIPTILRGASLVTLRNEANGETERLDILPTGPGDILLTENGTPIPGPGEAVITREASERLGLTAGGRAALLVNRISEDVEERQVIAVDIIGVLPTRADSVARVYAPLQVLLDIENYREGYAVPARGWPGRVPSAVPAFEGAFVLLTQLLKPVPAAELTVNTGFSRRLPLEADRFAACTGFELPDGLTGYEVRSVGAPANPSAVSILKDRLRGETALVIPFACSLTGDIPALEKSGVPLAGMVSGVPEAFDSGLPRSMPWPPDLTELDFDAIGKVLAPEEWGLAEGERLEISVATGRSVITIPLAVAGTAPADRPVLSPALLGQLRRGAVRDIRFDPATNGLVSERLGYRGFRLYARTIDDVPTLYRHLRDDLGIETVARVQAVERIQSLDAGLRSLFTVLAVLAVAGGTAALIASLYSSVQRKTVSLGTLRLLGMRRAESFFFPVYQAVVIALGGAVLAAVTYLFTSQLVNHVFAPALGVSGQLSRLLPVQLGAAVLLILGVGVVSSLVSAVRATRIDPGVAIRVE